MTRRRECFYLPGNSHPTSPAAVRVDDYLFSGPCSGRDPATGKLPAEPAQQATLAFENCRTLLGMAGFTLEDVIHVFLWVSAAQHASAGEQPFGPLFSLSADRPALHVIVMEMPVGEFVQVEVTAARTGRRDSFYLGKDHAAAMKGGLLCSGPIPGIDIGTGKRGATVERQTELAFQNLGALLEQAGCALTDLGRIFIWCKDDDCRPTVNRIWTEIFPDQGHRPARHMGVKDLRGDGLVSLEVAGFRGGHAQSFEIPGVGHLGGGPVPGFIPMSTRTGRFFYSAAIPPVNGDTRKRGEGATGKARQDFRNMELLLSRAGMTKDDVAHVFVLYRDDEHRQAFLEPWLETFPDPDDRPACHPVKADLHEDGVQLGIVAVAQ